MIRVAKTTPFLLLWTLLACQGCAEEPEPPEEHYSSCHSGNATECQGDELCGLRTEDIVQEGEPLSSVCVPQDCEVREDCPEPSRGSALCIAEVCFVGCVMTDQCPDGMFCTPGDFCAWAYED